MYINQNKAVHLHESGIKNIAERLEIVEKLQY